MDTTNIKLIIGGLILGVVSNAIWKWVDPIVSFISKQILGLLIRLFKKFSESIYQEIARGHREKISYFLLFISCIILITHVLSIAFRSNIDTIFTYLFTSVGAPPSERGNFMLYVQILFAFISIYLIVFLIRARFINDSISYFNQLLNIVAPRIGDKMRVEYLSAYAQIQNQTEYNALIVSLKVHCAEYKQKVPKFFWD